MTEYRVSWSIDVDADDHAEAARLAQRIQRDPMSIATVFEVVARGGVLKVEVDLLDPEHGLEPAPPVSVQDAALGLDRAYREGLVHALNESLGWYPLVTLTVGDVRARITDTIQEAEDYPEDVDANVTVYKAITDADLVVACECAAQHCDYGDEWSSAIDHALDIALEDAKGRAENREPGMVVVCEVAAKHERLHAMHEPTDLEKFRAHVEGEG